MPTSQDALSRLVDEADIRDATARFADTATRGDFDGFRRLWADDAVWTIAKPFEARVEAIVQMLHGWGIRRTFSSSSPFKAPSSSTATRRRRVASVTKRCEARARPTSETTASSSTGCAVRIEAGCSPAGPTNTCGSTPRRSLAKRFGFRPPMQRRLRSPRPTAPMAGSRTASASVRSRFRRRA